MSQPSAPDPFEQAKQLFLQGLDCYETGRFEDAEKRFVSSLELLPGRVSTLVNLAAARLELARPQEALAAADEVLALEPDNFDAWLHRGTALGRLDRNEEALASFEKVLALDALLAEPWLRHGQMLQSLKRPEQALLSYERALAIDPGLAQAWSNRGGILQEMKRLDEAARAFEQAIAHGGDAELHGYYLASVGAGATPATAPKRYVQSLFDDYAGQFDEHLVGMLHYRAHAVLAQHLEAPAGGGFRSALDLGCGTGLCGPLVKPMTGRLTGVDLSRPMMDKARTLGVYDRLAQADIVDFLRDTDETYDLVLAADVFIYVGDLAPIFDALHRVMDGAGTFCFSAELARHDSTGFELLPSLRYAHSEDYLRRLAAKYGFDVAKVLRSAIREDQREVIEGLFCYLTRR